MKAICYYRFSTLEQRKGNSIERQRESCISFIAQKGWEFTGEELIDEGASAFSGANLSGKLGEFERKARSGEYPAGTVLVVERMDRLSRKNHWEATDWLRDIVATGVSIATVDGAAVYRANDHISFSETLTLMLKASVANEESEKKSERLTAAFAKKRSKLADGHIMTRALPAWLTVENDKIVAIPDRAEIVRKIFQMSDEGHGRTAIAARLNREGVASWGHTATDWYPSFVSNILKNAAAIGEYQPMTRKGGQGRIPIGDVVRGYFPSVVDADVFARVNNPERRQARKHLGVRGRKLVNMLTGLAKCDRCAGIMTMKSTTKAGALVTKRKKDGSTRTYTRTVDESYLVCDKSQRGKCEFRTKYRYQYVIKAVLDSILMISMDATQFSVAADTSGMSKLLGELTRDHELTRERAARLLDLFSRTGQESAEKAWSAAEDEAKIFKTEIEKIEQRLAEARASVTPEVHLKRVSEVREMIDSPDEDTRLKARTRVMAALQATLSGAFFNDEFGGFTVEVKGGLRKYVFDQKGQLFVTLHYDLIAHLTGAPMKNPELYEEILQRELAAMTPEERARGRELVLGTGPFDPRKLPKIPEFNP
jgi:DNA invertase Pin-like site-specific DNA recombinase